MFLKSIEVQGFKSFANRMVFEFKEGDDGFRTWVRLYGGKVEQDLYLYPGMKNLTSPRE